MFIQKVSHYKALERKLEHDPRVSQLFNADLSHIQRYLFTELKIEPTSKVEVEYDKNDLRGTFVLLKK